MAAAVRPPPQRSPGGEGAPKHKSLSPNQISVGSVRCFLEHDARGGATDADLVHLCAVQANRGSFKFLTLVLHRYRSFGHSLTLFDNRGLILQLQLIVTRLQL